MPFYYLHKKSSLVKVMKSDLKYTENMELSDKLDLLSNIEVSGN